MTKCLLINPPLHHEPKRQVRPGEYDIPLGLAYIAAVLENSGVCVKVIDMPIRGIDCRTLKELLLKENPDIIGISCVTVSYPFAVKAAKICKGIDPKITTVLGGPHVTFTAEETLIENPEVDIVVRGEGEYTMLELVQAVENDRKMNHIHGITYRKDGEIIVSTKDRGFIQNLDSLPFPARHLFSMRDYLNVNSFTSIITSRGCPYNCIFCVPCKMFGHKFRGRTPKKIVDEIEYVVNTYNCKRIVFVDDLFTFDKDRVEMICHEIRNRNLDIEWLCSSRVDTVTESLLKEMKDAGCSTLFFGIESGNQSVLNTIKKGITLEQAERAVKWAQKANIEVHAAFIIGLPGDTVQTIQNTISFAERLKINKVSISPLVPLPGTEIYLHPERFKVKIRHRNWAKYHMRVPVIETEELDEKTLIGLWIKVLNKFFLPDD